MQTHPTIEENTVNTKEVNALYLVFHNMEGGTVERAQDGGQETPSGNVFD